MDPLEPTYGFLADTSPTAVWLLLAGTVLVLGYTGARLYAWITAALVAASLFGAPLWCLFALGAVSVVFLVHPVRRLLTLGIMQVANALGFLPRISETEMEAIDAGTVWIEGELFSGDPNFDEIRKEPYPGLSGEEQAFLDGPVQQLCDMSDDWDVFQRNDLPPEVWEFIKEHGFFGMIIPQAYGGLGFSASAHSAVIQKLASVSGVIAITVMVPNSLGPAELLIHYGTDAQKDRYLPRLARGREIPCFGLTEPEAGSDAGAITSSGIVFKEDDGELYLRLNWNKRYITLAPVATLLGLAFKLEDPENHLGLGPNPGITCALVPTDADGVEIGRRHDPLGVPFMNGPTRGRNVVVKLEDAIIGGSKWAGRGWRMLVETLAAGRGISLPATSTGAIKMVARVAGAHAGVRHQFGLPIGRFEGIEEPLARIGGFTYMLEALRRFTNGALDRGGKPGVVTAISKYMSTELFRQAINDGMDIQGGNGIVRGPRNTLANAYIYTPISITVEGANILTRTLVIFGQGAIRSHPYVLREITALQNDDVYAFDDALWKHVRHFVRNVFRSLLLSVSRGWFEGSPVDGYGSRYYRKLEWASARFAALADLAMISLGGAIKRKEKITGRFADIFAWMYLATAVLRRFETDGSRKEDRLFLDWSMQYALAKMQEAFDGLYANLRVPGLTWLLRGPLRIWSALNPIAKPPNDALGQAVARAVQTPGEQRDRLTEGIYLSSDSPIGRLDHALELTHETAAFSSRLREARGDGRIGKGPLEEVMPRAMDLGLISAADAERLLVTEELRREVIEVDSFSTEGSGQVGARPRRDEKIRRRRGRGRGIKSAK